MWERLSASLESVDVLKAITHHALLHMQEQQMIPFIHLASFDLNGQRTELLGALLAYGAVSSPSVTVRKFGYSMQELVRLALNQKVDPPLTPHPQCLCTNETSLKMSVLQCASLAWRKPIIFNCT